MSAPRAMALCHTFTGALEFQAGHWDKAELSLRHAIEVYREIGTASGEALACQRLGVLLTARGALEEAYKVLEEGVAAAESAVMRAHCLTRLYAAMTGNRLVARDLVAAEQVLALALDMIEKHGHCTTCNALLLPVAVSVRVAQGNFEAAEEFCQKLDAETSAYQSRIWLAMSRQARGELAAAQGSSQEALEHFIAASEGFKASDYDYEAARCQVAVAEMYKALNAEAQARIAQDAAVEIFEKLGAAY